MLARPINTFARQMDKLPKKTNLLILRGVYARDFSPIDSIYDKNSKYNIKLESDTVYTEIPKKFTCVESWPKFSNLKCWNCDQLPKSSPVFIPMNLEMNNISDVYGHFDKWECAVSHVIKEFPKELQWDALRAISIIESQFTGIRRERIMPAPPKYLMKQYCGKSGLTVKEWQDKLETISSDYNLTHYKLEHFKDT